MNFKYELGQTVKVQVFNIIIEGEITQRICYETLLGSNCRYLVCYRTENPDAEIYVWEGVLSFTQELPLGVMYE